jgi:hypothetical protein
LDDPKYVLIDLDFDGPEQAEAFLEGLRGVWSRVELSPGLARAAGPSPASPKARVVQEIESRSY